MKQLIVFCCLSALLFPSCAANKYREDSKSTVIGRIDVTSAMALPKVFVYKTRQDYSRNVPVIMNKEKTVISMYPAPSDVCPDGICAYPVPLQDGYLLDRRGIGANVVFLSYTYEEYAALGQTPSVNVLLEKIIDRDPLLEIYDCGSISQYTNLVDELNGMIRAGKLKDMRNLLD